MGNPLQWQVFVSTQIPVVTSDLSPGVAERRWSPISSTLISGGREAVLVDTFITVEQNRNLAEWIAASGKNLTTIYATHGHGDHFFGVNTIRERFPNARFVATRDVITIMRKQASSPVLESFWKSRFPGQIDSTLVIAEELSGAVIRLEGEELVIFPSATPIRTIRLASTSLRLSWSWRATLFTTMLGLPGGVERRFKEGMNRCTRHHRITAAWRCRRRTQEAGAADMPKNIPDTRQYIRDFDRTAADTQTAQELYDQMLALYPNRVNPAALWSSARGVKP